VTTVPASQLAAALRKGALPDVVAVIGPETLLRDEALKSLLAHALGDADSPAAISIQGAAAGVELEREALARFFDESRTRSLFGGAKAVVLRNAGAAAGRHKQSFQEWLAQPPKGILAVIEADELPAELLRALGAAGLVVPD
jgi:DNA polymerase III delta subunit